MHGCLHFFIYKHYTERLFWQNCRKPLKLLFLKKALENYAYMPFRAAQKCVNSIPVPLLETVQHLCNRLCGKIIHSLNGFEIEILS